MYRTLITGIATAAFMSGGLTVAGLGLAASAQADPLCSPATAKSAPCAPPEVPRSLRRQWHLRPAVVSRFGDVRNTEVGHECLPYLLLRSQRSVDQAGHHRGPASWSAGASSAAVHTAHQLPARVVIDQVLLDGQQMST